MKISKQEHERRLSIYHRMYPQGASCKDMAKEMFLSISQTHRWVKAFNLPYNRSKGNSLSKEEHDRRLKAYYSFKKHNRTNEELADFLGLHIECLRKWIRDNNMVQLNRCHTKIQIAPNYAIWDSRNGKVGNLKKRKSYVRNRPKWEIDNIRDFASTLLELNRTKEVSVSYVLKICKKRKIA